MNFLEKVLYELGNGKIAIKSPIFTKDFNKENIQLKDLESLVKNVPLEKRGLIERDIRFIKQGLDGENNVAYELKNSFLPFLCLHDVRIEHKDLVAQLDFVVISRKFICVLEVKTLSGDLEIKSDGNFIRIIKDRHGKVIKREGMYSPIIQNERHIAILKEALSASGIKVNVPIISTVVIANPKSVINKAYAYEDKVIRYDFLSNYLKAQEERVSSEVFLFEKEMYAISKFLYENDKPITFNYEAKYGLNKVIELNKEVAEKELKAFRFSKSKELNIKPYFIFNNEQMIALIEANPKNFKDLYSVKGFGQQKINNYGKDILNILRKAVDF